MKILSVTDLPLPGVKVIRFARFRDQRGYFTETFRRSDLDSRVELAGLKGQAFVQANESSSRANVVRGLHFQWDPFMGKLVRTISGHMVDIVLDLRKDSPTLGKAVMHDMPSDAGATGRNGSGFRQGLRTGITFRSNRPSSTTAPENITKQARPQSRRSRETSTGRFAIGRKRRASMRCSRTAR